MDGLGWYPSGAGLRSAGACRGDRRRACRLADVLEDGPYRGRLDDEGDDLHVGTAVAAGERKLLEKAGEHSNGAAVPDNTISRRQEGGRGIRFAGLASTRHAMLLPPRFSSQLTY